MKKILCRVAGHRDVFDGWSWVMCYRCGRQKRVRA